MDSKLFNAILAMDSYNRGYDQGIFLGDLDDNGIPIEGSDVTNVSVGVANIVMDSSVLGGDLDKNAGFYAVAYDVGGAGTIISYRGTNDTLDSVHGWPVFSGVPDVDQGVLAFAFYNEVAGGIDPRAASISLTGHSLGGGLAGLVGAVYGKEGTLFDNMPFELAANNVAASAIVNSSFGDIVYGNHNGGNSWAPTISSDSNSQLQSYSLDGEFLSWLRPLQQTPQTEYSLPGNPDLSTYSLNAGDLHSMASLIIHMYAETEIPTQTGWHAASPYFWPVMYQDAFAQSIGAVDAGTLGAKIAYSAIDSGAFIFGDTGIRAFYDDANELGTALTASGTGSVIETYATDISKSFVQFAGQLALAKIEKDVFFNEHNIDATEGVLSYTNTASNHTLSIDFSDGLWTAAGKGATPAMIARASLIGDILTDTGANTDTRDAMELLWNDRSTNAIDRVSFAVDSAGTTIISDKATPTSKATLFMGGTGADDITGSNGNDLIIAGAGNDVITGDQGDDILLGGSGDDIFYTSRGVDYIDGGDDNDIVHISAATSVFSGEGIVLGATDILNYTGLTVLKNIETIDLSFDVSGYFHVAQLGNDFNESLSPGTPVSTNGIYGVEAVPPVFTTLSYGDFGQSLTFDMVNRNISDLSFDNYQQSLELDIETGDVIYTGFSPIDTFDIAVGLVGTNYGDTYVLQNSAWRGSGSLWDGSNYQLPIFSGAGNDTFYWDTQENPNRANPIIYGGGDDVVSAQGTRDWYGQETAFDGLNGVPVGFIMPLGITAADMSFSLTNKRSELVSSINFSDGIERSWLTYVADGVLTINGMGTITFKDDLLFSDKPDSDGNGAASNAGMSTHFFYTQEADGLKAVWFGNSSTQSGHTMYKTVITDPNHLAVLEKNITFFDDHYQGTMGADNIDLSTFNYFDHFYGYDGDDVVVGSDAINDINGGAGNDDISGGAGDDILSGGAGNDILNGGLGDDVLDGGSGFDTAVFSNDFFYYEFSLDQDTIVVKNWLTNETDRINNIEQGLFTDGYYQTDIFFYFLNGENTPDNYIAGTSGNDSIFPPGNNENDHISGLNGNDSLFGGSGNDSLFGGAGNDSLVGGGGNDFLEGGSGGDGLSGNDGNDILIGGLNYDQAFGGLGDDTYIFRVGDSSSQSSGSSYTEEYIAENENEGVDTIKIEGVSSLAVRIWTTSFGEYHIKYSPTDEIRLKSTVSDRSIASTFEFVEFDDGTTWDLRDGLYVIDTDNGHDYSAGDHIDGAATNDYFEGRGGNDEIHGQGGDDHIIGGSGNDFLYGEMRGNGGSPFYGIAGNDILEGGSGNDFLSGDLGDDILIGDEGNDFIRGGEGFDQAIFSGNYEDYTISDILLFGSPTGRLLVTDNVGTDGADDVHNNVEQIVFADGIYEGGVFTPTVLPNALPISVDDIASVDEDGSVVVDVLANDSDADGDALTVTSVSGAVNGIAIVNADNTITYTPNANFNGTEVLTYVADDGNGGSSSANVTVNINAVNDAPVSTDDVISLDEDGSVIVDVLANDSDVDGDALTVTFVSGAVNGTAVLNADNTITYTPDVNFNGIEALTYTVDDGNGGIVTSNVNITIDAINDTPVAIIDKVVTDASSAITINVLSNDSDIEGDALTVTSVSGAVNGIAIVNADNTITYTPNAGATGVETLTYTVDDGNGGASTESVSIRIQTFDSFLSTALVIENIVGGWDEPTVDNWLTAFPAGVDLLLDDWGSNLITHPGFLTTSADNQNAAYDVLNTYLNQVGSYADEQYLSSLATELVDHDVVLGTNSGESLWNAAITSKALYGLGGNDYVFGSDGDTALYGGDGDDYVYDFLNGDDIISGGDGSDFLYGGAGADSFVFYDGETGVDTIWAFNTAEGDRLNINDYLNQFDPLQDAINDFVILTEDAGNTTVSVDVDGQGAGVSQDIAVLNGTVGLTVENLIDMTELV